MKKLLLAVLILASFVGGCSVLPAGKVKMYGPEYMIYSGDYSIFNEVCRTVMHEFSYKEVMDDKTVRYPYYTEGSPWYKENGVTVATKVYFKTKDKDGLECSITMIMLSGKEPIVVIDTANALQESKLVKALSKEFKKRGIIVKD
jgi:hypothetical protein